MTLGHGTLSLYCNVANLDFWGRRMDELAQYTIFKLHMHVAFFFFFLFFHRIQDDNYGKRASLAKKEGKTRINGQVSQEGRREIGKKRGR
jgi:hypothetical protein